MISQQMKNETTIKLPISFILYSLIAFVFSQVFLLFAADDMINGVFRTPAIWSAAHLLILGWALMVAMGAMYQLVPVAFLTPIWSERFGFFQFGISLVGVTSFAISLWFFPTFMAYTGAIAVLGILLFLFQMLMTLRKQAKKNILTLFVGSALVCLLATITLGIFLTININFGISGIDHLAILKTHILMGITGWFTLLIFGFSYKMVPMFALAHGFSMNLGKWVYVNYLAGLLVTILSFIIENTVIFQIGLLLLFVGFTLFTYHIYLIIKSRLKKKLDKPFVFSLLSILFGLLLHLFGFLLSLFPGHYSLFGLLIYVYLFSWIVFSIIGYLYKIVPFLWWTHRYSKVIGKSNVPTLKQMINDRLSNPIFTFFIIGVAGIVGGSLLKNINLFYISQLLIIVAVLVFAIVIINVVRK